MSQSTPSASTDWVGQTEFNNRIQTFASELKIPLPQVKEIFAEDFGVDGLDARSLEAIDSEDFTPFGDIRSSFIDKRNLTKLAMLRLALPKLRGKTPSTSTSAGKSTGELSDVVNALGNIVSSSRRKEDLTDKELLESLDETATEVAEILSKRTHARPCIVFDSSGNVDVESSLEMIKFAKRQPTRSEHMINGRFVRLFRVGDFQPKPLDESPLFVGKALVDGYCADSETSWKDIGHEVRVLARLYVQNETAKLSKMSYKQINHDARQGLEYFRSNYGKTALIYDELSVKPNGLPTLKIMPNEVRTDRPVDKAGM